MQNDKYMRSKIRQAQFAVACRESSLGYTICRAAVTSHRCGLQGIVARIHCRPIAANDRSAVACRESSLGYTKGVCEDATAAAVACRESSLGYTTGSRPLMELACCGLEGIVARIHSWPDVQCRVAVACRESSLGYTMGGWSDRTAAVAWRESSLGYTRWLSRPMSVRLWLAGNRRSDTLCEPNVMIQIGCGLQGIVARIH